MEPKVEEPLKAEPKAPPSPKLDPSKPLSQQTGILSKLMGDTSEPKKTDEEPKVPEGVVGEEPKEVPKTEPKEEPVEDEEEEIPEQKIELEGTWQKYVADNLPTITARIQVGDDIKTVHVKSDAQLPAGFKFADDAAMLQFTRDLTSQSIKAEKLRDEFNYKAQQKSTQEFNTQENTDVTSDIAYLQKQGLLGEFDESTPSTDANVKEANEIYDLFKKINSEYAQKYMGTNRMYRVSYRDAAYRYFALQKRQERSTAPKEEPKKEKPQIQREREEVARQQGAPAGGEPNQTRPKVQPGMTMNDINRLFRAGRI